MKSFQSFRLDPVNQCLWRDDRRVTITPKAFDVLRYLVEHPGRLVTQEEMLEALWPKAYVNPEVVKKYILAIRKALEDRPDHPIFIETVRRRGYQFVAKVSEEIASASAALSELAQDSLVGRDGALATLDRLLDRALQGQRQIVFVTGEPGIGKTALVDAFHQRAARRSNIRIARGQCVEGFGEKEAYYPMLEALGQLARDKGGPSIVQTLAARAPTWLIQFPSLVKTAQREALHREILGATRARMLREICEALESLTVADPLILVFEDLHWVDPSTLDLLSALARRRETAKLVLLATYRPLDVVLARSPLKGLKRDLQLHGLCEEIALEKLASGDVGQYLAVRFSGALPSSLAGLVHRHSAGHPLFMVSIVQDLQKKGLIARDDGAWKLTAPLERIDPGVPETLQQMLDAQFDQLTEPEQQILRIASVAGERFSAWLVSSSLEIEAERVEDVCETLAERQQFIRAVGVGEAPGGASGPWYEFGHALYREGIYRRLSEVNRSRLHRRIAERLVLIRGPAESGHELAAELARHFEYGHDYARAIEHLEQAADNAGARFAYRESIRILQHALKLLRWVSEDKRAAVECRIHELIGDAYYALGVMADSARSYEALAACAAHAGLRAAQVSALTSLVRPLGLIDPDRGIAAIDRAAQLTDGLGDPLLAARTRLLAATIRLLYDTWNEQDAALCTAAFETMRRLGDDDDASYHRLMYGHVLALQGRCEEALAIFDCAEGPASLIAHFFAQSGKTVALLRGGRFGEVLQIVREGKQAAEKNGNDPWLFNFREAWLRMLVFDFKGAVQLCQALISGAEYPTDQPRAIARICEAWVELDRGNSTRSIECFGEVVDPRTIGKFFLHWLWRMTAQLGLIQAWMAAGDVNRARAGCDLFLNSALRTSDPHFRAVAWDAKARVAMFVRSWDEAREHIDHALSELEGFTVPMAAWPVHATAHDWHSHAGNIEAAETHRAAAERYVMNVADSFPDDEPLRNSFLTAPQVRRMLALPRGV